MGRGPEEYHCEQVQGGHIQAAGDSRPADHRWNRPRSAAGGIALNLGIDVDELTDLYVDFYEATPADVTIELDEEDSLSSVEYTADLSEIYVSIFDRPEMFDPRPSDEELAQVEDLASDTEWVITVLQRFEVDDDLVVDPAPETDDDRTDQWVAFLENAGF